MPPDRPFAPLDASSVAGRTCETLASLGSEIRRTFLLGEERRKANPGARLIDLSLGNPDLDPPREVRDALVAVAADGTPGIHRYMDNAGYADVRAFLAGELTKETGVAVGTDSVFLTCGAAGALQVVMRVVLDPGDEVVLFAPYFSEYVPYTVNLQGEPVCVPTGPDHLPRAEDFEAVLGERTRLVILNSPNNPTGVVYPEATTNALFDALRRHRARTGRVVHVISDEPYANLVFPPARYVPLLDSYDALWMVRSHSKDLGLAGERIGYVAWGEALAAPSTLGALRNAARAMGFVNAPALMQRVLPRVYGARVDIAEYGRRVKAFTRILREGGVSCVEPGGSFFVFPSAPTLDDRAFATRLLEAGVLAVPGSGFGKPGYVRCSLTQPQADVEDAASLYVKVFHA